MGVIPTETREQLTTLFAFVGFLTGMNADVYRELARGCKRLPAIVVPTDIRTFAGMHTVMHGQLPGRREGSATPFDRTVVWFFTRMYPGVCGQLPRCSKRRSAPLDAADVRFLPGVHASMHRVRTGRREGP